MDHGQFREAYILYVQMQRQGLCPSTFSVSSTLRACAQLLCKLGGVSVHAHVQKYEICESVYVQTALLGFYAKVGNMETAQRVFHGMVDKNVVSWNSMLAGYLRIGDLTSAEQLFGKITTKDTVTWNSMLSGYARSGNMDQACSLFQQMPDKNFASWNAILSGYVDCGKMDLARSFFDSMPQRNSISWMTMITGYSKHGDVDSARDLFDRMQEKNHLSYNAMIACYAQNSRPKEAIELFKEIIKARSNVQPDKMTLSSVISACSQLGDFRFGSWIESYMKRVRMHIDDQLLTALVDLYSKCGNIDKAYEWFNSITEKDVVAYTAMISGLGLNGKAADTIDLFHRMLSSGVRPNQLTYTGILTAYNHAGLVEEGKRCFHSMKHHGVTPSADHYAIIVDLLGRIGRLDEAYDLIKSMPIEAHAGVWGALLLACRLHNNLELGEVAAQQCFKLEPDRTGYCSLLANIYADNERWDDVKRLRKVKYRGSTKVPGSSWVESA